MAKKTAQKLTSKQEIAALRAEVEALKGACSAMATDAANLRTALIARDEAVTAWSNAVSEDLQRLLSNDQTLARVLDSHVHPLRILLS